MRKTAGGLTPTGQTTRLTALLQGRGQRLAALLVMLVLGLLLTWLTVYRTDHRMRANLQQPAHLVARALDVADVKQLTGTEADCGTPIYLQIKDQLASSKSSSESYRFIYLMGRRPDTTIFFLVDSEPVGSEDESPAGQVFEEATINDQRVFDTGTPSVEGPVTDRWGTWISALVPLTDPATGDLIAVLGMDMDAAMWTWDVAAQSIPLAGGLWVVLILTATLVIATHSRAAASVKPLQNRLLIPLAIVLLLLVGGFGLVLLKLERRNVDQSSRRELDEVSIDLRTVLADQTETLDAVGQALLRDADLRMALRTRPHRCGQMGRQ